MNPRKQHSKLLPTVARTNTVRRNDCFDDFGDRLKHDIARHVAEGVVVLVDVDLLLGLWGLGICGTFLGTRFRHPYGFDHLWVWKAMLWP